MTKVILGNHTATYAARSDQDRIRKFYCDVLGCTPAETSDSVDHLLLDDVDLCFVWSDVALPEGNFMKAIYLELKTDNLDAMIEKILAFGVKKLDIPGTGSLYFQAPGGQVFKLVGIGEGLSLDDEATLSRPGASTTASRDNTSVGKTAILRSHAHQ